MSDQSRWRASREMEESEVGLRKLLETSEAEVERLREIQKQDMLGTLELRAEVERLKLELDAWPNQRRAYEAEVDRLRAALEQLELYYHHADPDEPYRQGCPGCLARRALAYTGVPWGCAATSDVTEPPERSAGAWAATDTSGDTASIATASRPPNDA